MLPCRRMRAEGAEGRAGRKCRCRCSKPLPPCCPAQPGVLAACLPHLPASYLNSNASGKRGPVGLLITTANQLPTNYLPQKQTPLVERAPGGLPSTSYSPPTHQLPTSYPLATHQLPTSQTLLVERAPGDLPATGLSPTSHQLPTTYPAATYLTNASGGTRSVGSLVRSDVNTASHH